MVEKEATLGAGCFWCIDACFRDLKGVQEVVPGYSGGHIKNPAYREVCTGRTGHVEVARITYEEDQISFQELLEMFFFVHDPTTLNRQGNDIGEQYRSVIFYHDQEQKELAERIKEKLDTEKVWENPIVTSVEPLTNFYPAEDYHHNYFNDHSDEPYCSSVVRPKVENFKKVFAEKLKTIEKK